MESSHCRHEESGPGGGEQVAGRGSRRQGAAEHRQTRAQVDNVDIS